MLATVPPPSSSTSVSPVAPACAVPVSTTAPVKSATNAEAGLAASSAGGPLLHHPAAVDHRHAVAEQGGLGEVVRHEQRGHARLAQQLAELAARVRARSRVERRERLVEQQRPRLARQRACERHALALAARERGRPAVGQVRHVRSARAGPSPAAGARRAGSS